MSITRLQALVQFRLGSHSLPVEQGRFLRPSLPRHLHRCDLCNAQAVGDELHDVFDCPRFGAIRAQYSNLFQDAEGSMRLFMWHMDQKAVSHCLTAILQMAQTRTQIRPRKPGWLNGRSAISLSLSLDSPLESPSRVRQPRPIPRGPMPSPGPAFGRAGAAQAFSGIF